MGSLRAIKIRSTSFGGEVKPLVSWREILLHFEEPYKYERDMSMAKFNISFTTFLLLRF
jgi:hypothetical protein